MDKVVVAISLRGNAKVRHIGRNTVSSLDRSESLVVVVLMQELQRAIGIADGPATIEVQRCTEHVVSTPSGSLDAACIDRSLALPVEVQRGIHLGRLLVGDVDDGLLVVLVLSSRRIGSSSRSTPTRFENGKAEEAIVLGFVDGFVQTPTPVHVEESVLIAVEHKAVAFRRERRTHCGTIDHSSAIGKLVVEHVLPFL